MDKLEKLQRLLRFHRQHVFDVNGDAHHRALLRLKRTATFNAMCEANQADARYRRDRALERMGY